MVNKASVVLSLITVIVALLVLEIGGLPDHTRLWREILNAGHIPLFGILALAVLRLSTELLAKQIQNRYVHYVIALTAAGAIGAGAEFLQIFLARDANVADFVRDVAGAACFLAIQSARDARLTSSWKAANAVPKKLLLGVSTLVLIAENDQVIPRERTENLIANFEKIKPKILLIKGANHNNISEFPEYIRSIIKLLNEKHTERPSSEDEGFD